MIARYLPGLGNPWKLTPGQWTLALIRIGELLEMETPPADADDTINRELKRTVRYARRKKLMQNGKQ